MDAGCGSQRFASDESGKQYISVQGEFDIANCSTVDSLPPLIEDVGCTVSTAEVDYMHDVEDAWEAIDEVSVDSEIAFDKVGYNWRRQTSASDDIDKVGYNWRRQASASDDIDKVGYNWTRQASGI